MDLRLPQISDPIFFNNKILTHPRAQAPKLWTAAPVWIAPEWKGDIYPAKAKPAEFLRHYAAFFPAIELNMTFYRPPTSQMIERWDLLTPASFRFCPKVIQTLSRARNLEVSRESVHAFCDTLRGLGPKLGPFFLQLPPHHGIHNIDALKRFLDLWPSDLRLAVEFRNASCFLDHQLHPHLATALAERTMSALITDTLGRRDVVHTTLTTPWSVLRFLGNELHRSDFVRLDQWLERFRSWSRRGVDEVYLFLHHPTFVNVPALARYVTQKHAAEIFDVSKALC